MPSSACKTCALRSEEHTSELQSHDNLVCRLLLEKKFSRSVAVELHVAERGDGNAVLLLHGFPELGYSWRHQVDALAAAGYFFLVTGMPRFGRSPPPAAIEA